MTGRGGHAAQPHLTRDPVLAASAIVLALQGLVSRETVRTLRQNSIEMRADGATLE